MIGGQTYREIDNGRAGVLVPVSDPLRPPALVAQQRKAVVDSLFMAQSPLAGGAYGVAALLGTSPQARDRAMMAGAVADAGISVATPRGAQVRRPTPPIKTTTSMPQDGSIRYRDANAAKQSRGVNAALGAPMLGTGGRTRQSVKPPGFISGKEPYYHNRAHLLGKQLGGHADEPKKIFAATRKMNSPIMRGYENSIARRVASGELIDYSVTPYYTPGVEAPSFITMAAWGDRKGPMAVIIENPLGRPKK
ncbi:DNA/RNA non-specific endonuclease [Phenylobacterium sp.]|uniref:DNA/RNA non-specific endonuclease n=1 Tax=Phenylobacterium sp. TaxID=1871053 RepID=UPI0025DB0CF1|nr:DNA/RNA non-specific endonuclease [Phenylobacterium sp.]